MNVSDFLGQSRAAPAFREAVSSFLDSGRANDRIIFDSGSPPVKVERTLTKLLELHPELEIERVEVRGSSGCEYYRGDLTVFTTDGEQRIRFYWDCKWKAEQEGWTDAFGLPDQIRAARTFGYDCFRSWEALPVEVVNAIA